MTGHTQKNLFSALGLALLVSGCVTSGHKFSSDAWYKKYGMTTPKTAKVFICHAYGCARRTVVHLTSDDVETLREILKADTAEAERAAISKAVQWFEKRVAPTVGSGNDVGGYSFSGSGVAGQQDCIDEATNTTSLLRFASLHNLLAFHRTASPVARGFFLDGRYPHATAVITEIKTGTAYAVDSWVRDNGERPDIMLLKTWFASRASAG